MMLRTCSSEKYRVWLFMHSYKLAFIYSITKNSVFFTRMTSLIATIFGCLMSIITYAMSAPHTHSHTSNSFNRTLSSHDMYSFFILLMATYGE